MATYIDNIVKFHTFSKSPVSKDTTLGGAVNPSGHTVTTSQVRAQDIPAFLNTFQGTKEQTITWLGNNYPTPAHNDIVFYGGEFKAGFSTPKCLIYVSKQEVDGELVDLPSEQCGWQDFDITTAATLKNADGKDVIAVHQNCTTVFVDGSNNAATNSNRNSLFVKRADGSILDHFVASTDKIVAGMPSLGYNALVLWDGAAIDEGELDANYIGNTFAGIVHLNKQYSTGDDAKFKVTCFEYIGDKLDTALSDIDGKIQDIVGTTMEGVVASVGTTTAATNAGISVDSSTKTSPKIDISTGTVGGESDAKLVTGSTVKTYVDSATAKATVSADGIVKEGDETKLVTATDAQNITTKVVSDATLTTPSDSSDAIKDATDTSKLVTAEQVKTYVTNNAQVTVKVGETEQATTNLELAGSAGSDVTITATADTADGYKVIFDATIDKAIVTDGVIDTATGNGDKVISATAAKTVAEKAIETALADTTSGSLGATIASKVSSVTGPTEGHVIVTTDDSTKAVTIAVSDIASAQTLSEVKATADSAIQTVKVNNTALTKSGTEVNITALTAVDTYYSSSANGIIIGETDKKVTLSVTPATLLTLIESGKIIWDPDTKNYFTTAADVTDFVEDSLEKAINSIRLPQVSFTASASALGFSTDFSDNTTYYLSLASAAYTKAEYDETGNVTTQGSWDDDTKDYLVTGDVVRNFVGDETAKTLADAKAYSDSLHTTSLDYIVLGDSESLPTASAETLGKIYLVASQNAPTADGSAISGAYVEYMTRKVGEGETATYTWEKIGTTAADLNAYAKTAELNVIETTVNGLTYSQTDGVISASVAKASTTQVGTVQLTDTYTSTDDTNAATGKSIAAAIDTLDAEKSVNGITVTQENGVITSVTEELITATVPANTTKVEGNIAYVGVMNVVKHIIAPEKFETAAQMPDTLTSWVADLSNLTIGDNMFKDCINLDTFVGDLSSLTSAVDMFNGCILKAESLEILSENLPTVSGGTIDIGASINATAEVIATIKGKGWTLKSNGVAL